MTSTPIRWVVVITVAAPKLHRRVGLACTGWGVGRGEVVRRSFLICRGPERAPRSIVARCKVCEVCGGSFRIEGQLACGAFKGLGSVQRFGERSEGAERGERPGQSVCGVLRGYADGKDLEMRRRMWKDVGGWS